MEVLSIGKNTIKIKSKKANIVVDPSKEVKTAAEIVIVLKESNLDSSKIEGKRIEIKGPGEYEISGVKIVAEKAGQNLICGLTVDGIEIFLTLSQVLEEALKGELAEKKDYHLAVINAEHSFNPEFITRLTARVVIFYGEKAGEALKELGKEDVKPVNKFATTLEKLPTETEIVILG